EVSPDGVVRHYELEVNGGGDTPVLDPGEHLLHVRIFNPWTGTPLQTEESVFTVVDTTPDSPEWPAPEVYLGSDITQVFGTGDVDLPMMYVYPQRPICADDPSDDCPFIVTGSPETALSYTWSIVSG